MSFTLITYLIYITLSLLLMLWVGRVFSRTGKFVLIDFFNGNAVLAENVNRLLLVGFYLLNVGYIFLTAHFDAVIRSPEHMIEVLGYKIGIILLLLAGIHFLNLIFIYRFEKKNGKREVNSYEWSPKT